jgi:hypothetical protein
MRNHLVRSLGVLSVFCLVLAIASPSFAQWRGYRGYARVDVDRLIRQAENRSDQFVRMFDRSLDRSRWDGRIREDRLNQQAMYLERELNRVRQEFNRTRNHYEVRAHVSNALSAAQGINNVMQRQRFNPMVERQWILLRNDLNRLAAIYNLRQLR